MRLRHHAMTAGKHNKQDEFSSWEDLKSPASEIAMAHHNLIPGA